jgi:hypothetical protein
MTAAMPPPTPMPALLGDKLLASLAALLLAGTLLGGTGGVAPAQEGGRCAADAPPSCASREDFTEQAAGVREQFAAAQAQAAAALAAARARAGAALERRDGSGGSAPGGSQDHAQSYTDTTMRTA